MATTIDSLLTALQAHLTTQTPLIPTLHAQLGLPPTALTDELNELHAALVECVDRKIDGRRKEVQEWMEKCGVLESECLKLARALGSNAKVIASSVGELRKQQVLPKRFEYLTAYQDKLTQLYQTKFEHLTGLTTKINSLVRIVGPAFFGSDVVTMASAPQGAQPSEEAHALRDVTPERFSKLEKELVRAKGEISRRLIHLSQTFLQVGWLHEELGIPLPCESDISSTTNLHSSHNGLTAPDPFLSASRSSLAASSPNTSTITPNAVEDIVLYKAVFRRFVARLQEASDESLDLDGPGNEAFGVESVEPTLGLIQWAEDTKTGLEDLKARREAHIQAIYNELDALWRRLGIEEAEMDAFVDANRGSTEANVQAYEAEHERMLELKRESMSIFIANARVEIEHLWDELILGDEERGSFAPFIDDEHTEELLTLHEAEIQRLKEERRIKAPLLSAIKKYFEICEEEKELSAAASDQSRLLGRGPRDPGRLLREEKMRKRVLKEKPRLEKDLLASIPAWQEEYRRQFLVNGVSIYEVLSETILAGESGKENRKRTRPGSVPPRGTTPQPNVARAAAATPAPNNENVGSSHSMPSKRARLGNSSVMNGASNRAASYNYGPASSSPHKPFGNKTNTPPRSRTAHYGYNGTGVQKPGKTLTSSLPRPIPSLKSSYGIGQGHNYNDGHGMPRIPSNISTVSNPGVSLFSIMSGAKGGCRRASFKPRPSIDGPGHDIGASVGGVDVGRQWANFVGRTVKEEDEY